MGKALRRLNRAIIARKYQKAAIRRDWILEPKPVDYTAPICTSTTSECSDGALDDKSAEAKAEEDDQEEGSVAAPSGAMPAESDSSSPSEPCGCSTDVMDEWLEALEADIEVGFNEALDYLAQAQDFATICNQHWQDLAVRLGLRTMHVYKLTTALERLHQGRDDPWGLKTNLDTYDYFKPAQRPQRPREALGLFLFQAEALPYRAPSGLLWEVLQERHPAAAADWNTHGAATLDGVLSW
ncbi:hypothetical protein MMC29_003077 [Sticta canariensis]|nr:hypothetical protein [Sticta canariensis]